MSKTINSLLIAGGTLLTVTSAMANTTGSSMGQVTGLSAGQYCMRAYINGHVLKIPNGPGSDAVRTVIGIVSGDGQNHTVTYVSPPDSSCAGDPNAWQPLSVDE